MKLPLLKSAALLVPVLVLGGISVLHAWNQRNGLLWQVPITGYDPRDLLSGHYLQFSYDWNLLDTGQTEFCQEEACGLCAENPAELNPLVTLQPLAVAQQCPGYIAGTVNSYGEFQINGNVELLDRYYIPEAEATRLDTLLREQPDGAMQFVMHLRVNEAGTAFIDTLYLEGMPLEEWLRTH